MSDSDNPQVRPTEQRGGPTPGDAEARRKGETTGSDAPATEDGIDPTGGARADAVTDGGAAPARGTEPDLRDAAAGPRQADLESASDDGG